MTDKKDDNIVLLDVYKATVGLHEIELPVSIPLEEMRVSHPTLALGAENFKEHMQKFGKTGGYTVLAEPRYLNFVCADECRATLMAVMVRENDADSRSFVRFDLEFLPPPHQPNMTFPGGIKKDVSVWFYLELLKSKLGAPDNLTPDQIIVKLLGNYLKWLLSNNVVKNEKDMAIAKPGEFNALVLRCGRYVLASELEIYINAINCKDIPLRVMDMLEVFSSELDKKDTALQTEVLGKHDLEKELASLYKLIDGVSELMDDLNDLTKIFDYV